MFSILARLGLDSTGFRVGVKQAEGAAKQFTSGLNSNFKSQLAGMFGTAAIAAGFAAAIRKAGELTDRASKLGVSPETLQEREFALKQNGGTLEDYERALIGIGKARARALEDPKGSEANAFARLGVTIEQIKSANADEVFKSIGAAVQKAGNSQEVLSDGLTTMGKVAPQVFAAMKGGLDESAAAARELGLVIGEDTLDKLDELGDKFDMLKTRSVTGFAAMADAAIGWTKKMLDGFDVVATGAYAMWEELKAGQGQEWTAKQTLENMGKAWNAGTATAAQEIMDKDAALAETTRKKRAERDKVVIDFQARPEFVHPLQQQNIGGSNLTNLQKIGAQVSSSNESFTIMRQQLSEQKRTTDAVKRLGDKLDDGGFQ